MTDLVEQLRAKRFFSLLSAADLESLVSGQTPQQAAAGTEIVSTDGALDDHLVLLDGQLEIRRASDPQDAPAHVLSAGQGGNDVAVQYASVVPQSVRAATAVSFLRINADRVDEMLGWNLQVANAARQVPKMEKCVAAVNRVSVFHKLPMENLTAAFERMVAVDYAAGDTVVEQGEKGERYFVIESGQAEVWQTDPFTDETSCVAELGPGESFGEEALLQDGMRNATVKMATAGRMLALEKADFVELVQPGLLKEYSAEEARDLVGRGEARWLDCRYDMEYEDARIPGAPLVPLTNLREQAHTLDPNATYIVYCRSGRRSKAAAFLLRERNFNAYSMTGGIKNWPFEVDDSPLPG